MNKEQQASVSIKKFLLLLQGLTELEAELADVGSLRQAAAEIEGRIEIARRQEKEAFDKLALAQSKVEEAKEQFIKNEADAAERARAIIINAEEEAQSLVANASQQSSEILAAIEAKKSRLEKLILQDEGTIKALEAKISEATQRYENIRADLNRLAEKVRVS